jgi:hypothetical protein
MKKKNGKNMDKSDKYIKMCQLAVEIQKDYNPTIGDFVYFNGMKEIEDMIVSEGEEWQNGALRPWAIYDSSFGEIIPTKEQLQKTVWLPRQDQLQEMIKEYYTIKGHYAIENLTHDFNDFVGIDCPESYLIKNPQTGEFQITIFDFFNSMEQLWLAFVMRILYNKVWDLEIEEWKERQYGQKS